VVAGVVKRKGKVRAAQGRKTSESKREKLENTKNQNAQQQQHENYRQRERDSIDQTSLGALIPK
jgi:hypothetical protein